MCIFWCKPILIQDLKLAQKVKDLKKFLVLRLIHVSSLVFLSSVVLLVETAGFSPFLLQLLALRLSTCLDLGHPPSSNQSSLSPTLLASSRFFSVVFAFSCHSLQDPGPPSKHYRHSFLAHVHTI